MFPGETGIVHISGVEADIDQAQFRDKHRLLIGPKDVMSNRAQISDLERLGYTGFYSFEPFSPQVQKMSIKALSKALDESLELIQSLAIGIIYIKYRSCFDLSSSHIPGNRTLQCIGRTCSKQKIFSRISR